MRTLQFPIDALSRLRLAVLVAALILSAGGSALAQEAAKPAPAEAEETQETAPAEGPQVATSPAPDVNAVAAEIAPLAPALPETGPAVTDPPEKTGSTATDQTVSNARVTLPFGFNWGQTQKDVRYQLQGIGVKVKSRKQVGPEREAWELDGFIKPLLVGTSIYFTRGYMEEVEMQFGSEKWGEAEYTRLRTKLLEQFNQVYGPNRVIENERSTRESVRQTLVGYQWQTRDTIVRVFDFGAVGGPDERYRTVSVHYKYRDALKASGTLGQ